MQWIPVSTLLLAAGHATAQPNYPADIEIDLIFPRPDGTYKRIYPFPVVYGIRNAAAVWPYELRFDVSLQGGSDSTNEQGERNFSPQTYISAHESLPPFEGGIFHAWSLGDLPADQDPFYAAVAFDEVVNATEVKRVTLYWNLDIRQSCAGRDADVEVYMARDNFTINLSEDGELPDLSRWMGEGDKEAECPLPLHAVRLSEVDDRRRCVMVDRGARVETDACRLRPTADVRDKVVKTMLKEIECPEGTAWPDEERSDGCSQEEWEAWKAMQKENIGLSLREGLGGFLTAGAASMLFCLL